MTNSPAIRSRRPSIRGKSTQQHRVQRLKPLAALANPEPRVVPSGWGNKRDKGALRLDAATLTAPKATALNGVPHRSARGLDPSIPSAVRPLWIMPPSLRTGRALVMALFSPDSKPRIEAILQVLGPGHDAVSLACTGTSPVLLTPLVLAGTGAASKGCLLQRTRATCHRGPPRRVSTVPEAVCQRANQTKGGWMGPGRSIPMGQLAALGQKTSLVCERLGGLMKTHSLSIQPHKLTTAPQQSRRPQLCESCCRRALPKGRCAQAGICRPLHARVHVIDARCLLSQPHHAGTAAHSTLAAAPYALVSRRRG